MLTTTPTTPRSLRTLLLHQRPIRMVSNHNLGTHHPQDLNHMAQHLPQLQHPELSHQVKSTKQMHSRHHKQQLLLHPSRQLHTAPTTRTRTARTRIRMLLGVQRM